MPKSAPEELCPSCTIRVLIGADADEWKSDSESVPEIPGFVVHEEVGEGGFGIVYRATESGVVRRQVALKVLKPGIDTRQVLRRFQVEQQALALLEHPNIARIYQAGESPEGYPFFTMEYIDGVPITDFLASWEVRPLLEIYQLVCGAVGYANQKGVVHRDLKPSNILVTREGVPKVIDFGVAKASDPDATPGMTYFTGDETWLGTPSYMAPEQANPDAVEIDARTDVYALGAILYELLAGMPPLDAALGDSLSPQKAKEMIGKVEIPRPSRVALREIPAALDWIVVRALESEPDRRYDSAMALGRDLRCFLDEGPIEARGPSMLDKARRCCLENRKRPMLVGAMICGLLLGAFFIGDDPEEVAAAPPLLVPIRHESSGRPFRSVLHEGSARGLAVFRSGGRPILFESDTGAEVAEIAVEGSPVRCAAFSMNGERFLLGNDSGLMGWYSSDNGLPLSAPWSVTGGRGPVDIIYHILSPDRKNPVIYTASGDAQFKAWNESGRLLWDLSIGANPYNSSMSPDQSLLAVGSVKGTISLINLAERRQISILEKHTAQIADLVFSPNGKFLASASHDDSVCLWRADGTLAHTLKHPDQCVDVEFSPDGKLLATACCDGFARLWSVQSGQELHLLRHLNKVYAVAFSASGRVLATGGLGKAIRFWSAETGLYFKKPVMLEAGIRDLGYTEDGHLLALTWEVSFHFIPYQGD